MLWFVAVVVLLLVGLLSFQKTTSNHITIQCKNTLTNQYILQECFQYKTTPVEGQGSNLVLSFYKNTKWLLSKWSMQMVANHGIRKLICYAKSLRYERNLLQTEDGGTFSLEWYPRKPTAADKHCSIVVVLHGITGSHLSYYIQYMVQHVHHKTNYFVVVVTRRSCGDLVLSSQYLANDPSDTSDLEQGLSEIKKVTTPLQCKYMHAIGFSFGGIQLSRLLTTKPNLISFHSIMLISVPFCIHHMEKIAQQQHPIVKKAAVWTLQHNFLKKKNLALLHKNPSFCEDHAWKASSTQQWNESVTFRTQKRQYSSLQQFYQESSAKYWIHHIPCPCLILNAADDPLCSIDIVKELGVNNTNPHLIFAQTQFGGHCTFSNHFSMNNASWLEELAVQFIKLTNNKLL